MPSINNSKSKPIRISHAVQWRSGGIFLYSFASKWLGPVIFHFVRSRFSAPAWGRGCPRDHSQPLSSRFLALFTNRYSRKRMTKEQNNKPLLLALIQYFTQRTQSNTAMNQINTLVLNPIFNFSLIKG